MGEAYGYLLSRERYGYLMSRERTTVEFTVDYADSDTPEEELGALGQSTAHYTVNKFALGPLGFHPCQMQHVEVAESQVFGVIRPTVGTQCF